MKQLHEPTYSFVILTAVLIIIHSALAYLSAKIFPAGESGVSWLYVAVAFMILFTLWFGAYGAIAAYLGTLIGAGLMTIAPLTQNPGLALVWALSGLLQVLIPLVAIRTFNVDLSLENRRDWTVFLIFGVLINNVAGAAWGAWTLSLINHSHMISIFSSWLMGNIIVTILIVPLALRYLTPEIRKSKLFVKYYWE
jgi:hypothetical protein